MNLDKSKFYQSEILAGKVHEFIVDKTTHDLRHNRTFHIGYLGDNINLLENGKFIVAGHPRVFEFLDLSKGKRPFAPSRG